MSHTKTSKSRSPPTNNSHILDIPSHPAFKQAVFRVANGMFHDALKKGLIRRGTSQGELNAPIVYKPRMDLIDDPQANIFTALFELPGMKSSDVAVRLRDGQLIIVGERKAPYPMAARPASLIPPNSAPAAAAASDSMQVDASAHSNSTRVVVQELRFGSFERRIPVPEGIKESDVTARLAEGMLVVTWPRSAVQVKAESTSPPASTSSRTSLEAAVPATHFTTGSSVTAGTASQ